MRSDWKRFESIVRRAHQFTDGYSQEIANLHPFENQNIHDKLLSTVKQLFDDGHFAEATFEAFKYLDKEVQRLSASNRSGVSLMMNVFGGASPPMKLTSLTSQSDKDEQEGYKFLFAGSVLAIRNPRGHEFEMNDDPNTCLSHLGLVSLLLRRLEVAGYELSP